MTKGGDTEQTMAKHLILQWADGRCWEPQGWCTIVTCGTGQTPTDPRRTWQDNSTHTGVHQQNQDTRPRRITVAKRIAVIMAFFTIYDLTLGSCIWVCLANIKQSQLLVH